MAKDAAGAQVERRWAGAAMSAGKRPRPGVHYVSMEHIGAAKLRALAVAADCDPRTVRKVLRGERVTGMAAERARVVLRKAGIKTPPPPKPKRGIEGFEGVSGGAAS